VTEPSAPHYARLRAALGDRPLPAVLVDLAAFDANVATALRAVADHPVRVRVGSKSVRCVALLRRAAEGLGARFGGVLGFHPREAKHLVAQGFHDILVAYPSAHPADLDALCDANASGATVTAMIDDAEQLTRLDARARARGVVVPVALDVDMAWRAGPAVLGVRRSPLRAPEAVLTLARAARAAEGVSLRGVMGYEAQIAGLTDRDAHGRGITSHRVLKALSRPDVLRRRAAVCAALRAEGFALDVVNGGGTGSLKFTAADPAVNEVVLGSGLLGPHLFDGLDEFAAQPAACFALQAVRRPAPDMVTCLGGGWIASGAAGPDRLPRPWLPEGLALLPLEGAGEVQTPVRGAAAREISLGDPVFFRHAKAGEPMDRVDRVLLVQGDTVVAEPSTYRGDGLALV
jgi:D-serine deaminase-like pyridoxal phosphate-dependent protein